MKVTVILIVAGSHGRVPNGLEREWKNSKSEEDYSIVEIGQKSLGDMRRIVVTQSSVKAPHPPQSKLVGKTHKEYNNQQKKKKRKLAELWTLLSRQTTE